MPRNTISEYGGAVVYIVRCSDGSYYTGRSLVSAEKRVSEHNLGIFEGYTKSRRPVTLVFSEHFDRIIRYLRLVERYCRDADQALREIDEFPWSDFKGGRGYLAVHRERLLSGGTSPAALFGGVDWFVRVVATASTFRHDWYLAVGAFLHGRLAFRELDAHLREARDAFPQSADMTLAWGTMREAQASPRLAPLLMSQGSERPNPRRALEDAERSYRQALDRDPQLDEARLRRGKVLVALGRHDHGYADLVAARESSSGDRRISPGSLVDRFSRRAAGRRRPLNRTARRLRCIRSARRRCSRSVTCSDRPGIATRPRAWCRGHSIEARARAAWTRCGSMTSVPRRRPTS